jgi:formamidopyrimidine-DNA glycosylase
MPELPEVQTIINTLSTKQLFNRTIIGVKVYTPKLLKNCSPKLFQKFILDESIKHIDRIGKYLIFQLSHDKVLTIHLRMEGKLFNEPINSSYPRKHLRIELILNNKHALRYYDSRMFGTFHIYTGNKYLQATHISKVALDPLNHKFD